MEYNTKYKQNENEIPKREDGQVGVRATLRNMGFSNEAIGYDETSGTVTLNGKALLKPGYLDEAAGVSYAKAEDIQKSVANFYTGQQNAAVKVSDAFSKEVGKYGLSADALSYSNGTVTIGGKPLDILYIDAEGKSWASPAAVKNAVNTYVNESGVESPAALAKKYADTYLSGAKELLGQLQNRKAFSYNPDEDPVFWAYQKKYHLEGDRAGKEAVAGLSTLTGGQVNSAAATAGAQARQYYAQQLSNTLPELAQKAYERYIEKYQTDFKLLGSMLDVYKTAYQNAADANAQQRDFVNQAAASNVERDRQNLEAEKIRKALYWDEIFNQLDAEGQIYTNEQKEIYRQYYERLLQAELSASQLDNQLKAKKLALGKV